MPNFGERLQWATERSPIPKLELSKTDWQALEKAYGQGLSPGARSNITRYCNTYFVGVAGEKSAATESEVRTVAGKVGKKVDGFVHLTQSGVMMLLNPTDTINRMDLSDAQLEFEHRFGEQIELMPIRISTSELRTETELPEDMENFLEDNNLSLVLNDRILTEIGIRIASTLSLIKEGKAKNLQVGHLQGFVRGSAFKILQLKLHAWAKRRGSPRSLYSGSGEEPGPLVKMLSVLHGKFPNNLKHEQLNSESSLAKQMKRSLQKS